MRIVIDEREPHLFDKCNLLKMENMDYFKDIQVVKKVLILGDISIETDDENILCLIERKSFQDLLSSIKDGRYDEQSHRLTHCSQLSTHNILYLIEGMFSQLRDAKEKKIIYSAITSLNLYKGFSVLRTCSLQETAETVMYLASKIEKNTKKDIPFKFHLQNNSNETENSEIKNYSNFVKKSKKENITPENIGEIFLCQIPSISSQTAISIMNEYKTINNLIKNLYSNPDCLNNILCGKRKIGKNCIENIKLYLLEKSELP